jgi:2-polyprenyl-3-methyl-5-hydroxy-6-metoxy-1,4-benzoquinol methylase
MAMDTLNTCWVCDGEVAPDPVYATTGYWRCVSCGLLLQPSRASAEAEAELYDSTYFADYAEGGDYEDDSAQRRFEARKRMPFVRRHAPAGGRLLELGAAAGHFVAVAAADGYVAEGVEPAADLAAAGSERLGVTVHGGTLESLDPVDGKYDVICAWHVLEHLPQPREALARMADLLLPGSVVLLEVPNVGSVLGRRDGETWARLFASHHVSQFDPVSMGTLLRGGGFEPLEVQTISALSYLRPGRRLTPRGAAAVVKEAASVRSPWWRSHPTDHEYLRIAARRPA